MVFLGEEHSKVYMKYSARVPQPKKPLGAKRVGEVSGSARKQDNPTQKPFAVFDIDGTLIRWQLYHAIADTLADLGYIDKVKFQAVKETRMRWKKREHSESFKNYERQLVETVDAALTNLTVKQFDEAIEAVFDEYKDQVYTYTRDLIAKLKKKGYTLFALSGSQEQIVEKIAGYYGFDDYMGSTFIQKNGKFTGEKIVRAHNKHELLAELVKKHGVTYEGSVAVGDGAGDISMLEAVEKPIALNPEKKLFEHAKDRGWTIVIERKNVVYELEKSAKTYVLK